MPAWVNGFVDGADLVLLRRNESGDLLATRRPAPIVSYHPLNEVTEPMRRWLRELQEVKGFKEEGAWLRISWVTEHARQIACVRTRDEEFPKGLLYGKFKCSSREADVDPILRHFSDTDHAVARPKRAFLDLETDSRKTFTDAKAGKARILSWAIEHEDGESRMEILLADTDDAERRLLERMWKFLERADQIIAWNGDEFDFPVMQRRTDRIGAECKDPRRYLYLDLLQLYARMAVASSGEEKVSLRLEDVAHHKLGTGKDDSPGIVPGKPLGAQTWELWEAGGEWRALLGRYNLKDTLLLRALDAKTGHLAINTAICEVCRIFANTDSLNPINQVDGYMLRLGVERGSHFATRPSFADLDENRVQFKGAFVMEPTGKGIVKNVHVADFAGMYPSIMITWNMSPDTLANEVAINGPIPTNRCRSPSNRVGFRTDMSGMLTGALKDLRRLRAEWSKAVKETAPGSAEWSHAFALATAYKVAANSFYGVIGSAFSRYFDMRIAEGVTQNGVWLIRHTKDAAEKRGWNVIYADTDSVFVTGCTTEEFKTFVAWCNKELYPKLVADCGCVENAIEIAYEKEFERIVFTSAKKYCGWYAHYKGQVPDPVKGKPEIKGLEYMRGDGTRLARALQGDVIKMLTKGREEKPDAFVAMVEKVRSHLLFDALPLEEVAFAKSLSRSLREYVPKKKTDGTNAAEPLHVQIARVLKARGEEVHEGTKIAYVVTDASDTPMKAIPAGEYTGECDRFYLWEQQTYPPTARLLEAAFPEYDWKAFLRVRPGRKPVSSQPAKPSANGVPKRAPKKPAPSEQASLFGGVPALKADEPYVVHASTEQFESVRTALARHPGRRACDIVMAGVPCRLPVGVAVSEALVADVARALAT